MYRRSQLPKLTFAREVFLDVESKMGLSTILPEIGNDFRSTF